MMTGSFLFLIIFALPTVALAAAPPYSYVEAGYNSIDIDTLKDDGDGYFFGASFGFLKNWHVLGQYSTNETDTTKAEFKELTLGGGWHGLLGERADVVGELFFIDTELENVSDTGWAARAGVRWRMIKFFELGGYAKYQDPSDLDLGSEVGYEAQALLYIWRLGIGVSYQDINKIETANAFVRFNFDKN
jgi:hypothetical protein